MTFPLYDSLIEDVPEKDLTGYQKSDFVKKINSMDNEGHERIYALIKKFFIMNEVEQNSFNVPYGGKFVKNNDISFDLKDIPIKLRQILYKFAKIHMKKLKEDKKLEKERKKR